MSRSTRWLLPVVLASLAMISASATRADDPAKAADEQAIKPEERPKLLTRPGEDAPEPFVPLKPRTSQDRKRIESLRDYTSARAYEDRRQLAEAVTLLEKALANDPGANAIVRRLAKLNRALGRNEAFIETSRKAIQADPNDAETISLLVTYYAVRKNDPAAAEAFLNETLANPNLDRKAPPFLLIQNDLGRLYAGPLRKVEKAADAYAIVMAALDDRAAIAFTNADLRRILGVSEANTYLEFGRVFLTAGRVPLAIQAFERGLTYDPDHPLIPLILAETQLDNKQGAAALAVIDRYLKRQPSGREPYDLLVKILESLKRDAEILPHLERSSANDPKNLALRALLADRFRLAGQVDKANAIYKELLAAQPDLQGVALVFTTLLKEKKTEELLKVLETALTRLNRIELLKPQIDELIADSAYTDDVLDTGLKMLSADPPSLGQRAWLVLINIASTAEKNDKYLALLRWSLDRTPSPLVYREMMRTLATAEKYDEAEAAFNDLIKKFPDERNARSLTELCRVRLQAGKAEQALEAAREALKLEPNDEEALRLTSLALLRLGKADEALATIQDVLKKSPNNLELSFTYGTLLTQVGRLEEAATFYKELIDRNAGNEELIKLARSTLSTVYSSLGDFPKAEAELETLLEKEPDDPGINNDLGYLYADQGKNLDRAESMVRKALQEKPDEAAYLDSLGWVLFKQGKPEDALSPLEKAAATARGATDVVIMEHLGDAYFQLKSFAKAKDAWKKAEAAAGKAVPPDKRLAELRKKLETLDKLGNSPKNSTGENP
ncbi:tetratricopeptide repeat protein [Isosphaeraceae bacterium EP7]